MYYYHGIITKVIQLIQRVKINECSRYNHVHSLIILHHIWQYTTLYNYADYRKFYMEVMNILAMLEKSVICSEQLSLALINNITYIYK